MTSKLLTAHDIEAVDDKVIEPVEVPEWGGAVGIRGLTADERDEWEESCHREVRDGKGQVKRREFIAKGVRAKLIARCAVDADGNQLFGRNDAKAIKLLGRKSAAAVNRLWDVAARLSGVTEADVEELVGNSDVDPDVEPSSAELQPSTAP